MRIVWLWLLLASFLATGCVSRMLDAVDEAYSEVHAERNALVAAIATKQTTLQNVSKQQFPSYFEANVRNDSLNKGNYVDTENLVFTKTEATYVKLDWHDGVDNKNHSMTNRAFLHCEYDMNIRHGSVSTTTHIVKYFVPLYQSDSDEIVFVLDIQYSYDKPTRKFYALGIQLRDMSNNVLAEIDTEAADPGIKFDFIDNYGNFTFNEVLFTKSVNLGSPTYSLVIIKANSQIRFL